MHAKICLFDEFFVVSVQYMYDFLDAMITQQTSPEEVCIELIMYCLYINQFLMQFKLNVYKLALRSVNKI